MVPAVLPLALAAGLLAPGDPTNGDPTAGDWPGFLGPNGDGTTAAAGLAPAVPDAAAALAWTAKVGEGYSAPAVVEVKTGGDPGGAVLTHRRVGRREVLARRDAATGETIWETAAPTAFRDPYGYNGGPRASPLVVRDDRGGRVYTLGAAGRAACMGLETGEELWARDFRAELDVPRWFFGVGGSPVYYDGDGGGRAAVVFAPGGQPDAGLVACDPATGETLWTAVGKSTWDGAETGRGPYAWTGEEQVVSYSTPTLATVRGEPMLFFLARQGLVGLDPRTGRGRFRYWFRSRTYESVNAVRPVVVGDRVLICATYGVGAALLEVNTAGDGVSEVWRNPRVLNCHWSTPVVHDGLAYGFAGRHETGGALECVDLATGELKWSADGRGEAGKITFDRAAGTYRDAAGDPVPWPDFGRGSCALAPRAGDGGTLYILGERGTLFCARPSGEGYEERSRTTVPGLSYPAWPAPAVAGGRLFLADGDGLTVLNLTNDE